MAINQILTFMFQGMEAFRIVYNKFSYTAWFVLFLKCRIISTAHNPIAAVPNVSSSALEGHGSPKPMEDASKARTRT